MIVPEDDVRMDEIADGLDPRPARLRLLEQFPGDIGQAIGFAITAAQQIHQRVRRQVFDGMLACAGKNRIRQTVVANDAVGGEPHGAGRRNDAAAPIAEAVSIGRDRHRGSSGQKIGYDDVGGAREVSSQHQDDRRRLRELVQHFITDANLHGYQPSRVRALEVAMKPSNTRL